MNIGPDTVVRFHYRLSEAGGAEIESSMNGEPLVFLYGHGNILPALEQAMSGHVSGEHLSVSLTPVQAYGPRRDGLQQRVPVKHLVYKGRLRPGVVARVQTEKGPRDVRIIKLGRFSADVDMNHPFAGLHLDFEVEILEVRAASAEEIAHGHVHGPGGHQH